ncbi:hypothetical protein FKM82_001758 [Ascaphus truei]
MQRLISVIYGKSLVSDETRWTLIRRRAATQPRGEVVTVGEALQERITALNLETEAPVVNLHSAPQRGLTNRKCLPLHEVLARSLSLFATGGSGYYYHLGTALGHTIAPSGTRPPGL